MYIIKLVLWEHREDSTKLWYGAAKKKKIPLATTSSVCDRKKENGRRVIIFPLYVLNLIWLIFVMIHGLLTLNL